MKIIECPRDAMQGIHAFIPTEKKIEYINQLLQVGYDSIDFGSFVSPKAIPQLSDTAEVLAGLVLKNSHSKLLAIIANLKGAEMAVKHDLIDYLGYPFSISETFQQRNANRSISDSYKDIEIIHNMAIQSNKEIVLYISMGFGNPYGDAWNPELVSETVERLSEMGITIFNLSDTVGSATIEDISSLFSTLIPKYDAQLEFGAHFHSTSENSPAKLEAAWEAGCRRLDSAIMGFGGCPMASDELTGNTSTEDVLSLLEKKSFPHSLDRDALYIAQDMASEIFNTYH